jgi:ribonuclease HI
VSDWRRWAERVLGRLASEGGLAALEEEVGVPRSLRGGALYEHIRAGLRGSGDASPEPGSGPGASRRKSQRGRGEGPGGGSRAGRLLLYADGASKGNPGPAGIGVVATTGDGAEVGEISRAVGRCTNNAAEYRAVLAAVEYAHTLGAREVVLHVDSELVARQLEGRYRVRSPDLLPLFEEARAALGRFRRWEVRHVPRERNHRADRLANDALKSLS